MLALRPGGVGTWGSLVGCHGWVFIHAICRGHRRARLLTQRQRATIIRDHRRRPRHASCHGPSTHGPRTFCYRPLHCILCDVSFWSISLKLTDISPLKNMYIPWKVWKMIHSDRRTPTLSSFWRLYRTNCAHRATWALCPGAIHSSPFKKKHEKHHSDYTLEIAGPSKGCQMVPKGCQFKIPYRVISIRIPCKVLVDTVHSLKPTAES